MQEGYLGVSFSWLFWFLACLQEDYLGARCSFAHKQELSFGELSQRVFL